MRGKMNKRITVTKQAETGLNTQFRDNLTGRQMSRAEFADAIDAGKYPKYHVAEIQHGSQTIRVPKSNPDQSTGNNLG